MKVNQKGVECPAWCAVDHSEPNASWSCRTAAEVIGSSLTAMSWAEASRNPEMHTGVTATAYKNDADPEPGKRYGWVHAANRQDAESVARFLDTLASTDPGNIGALANQVRQAAALAFPENEPEAG